MFGRRFGIDDVAQQVVGGVLLSAPFVVTEEVWTLASSMSWVQTGLVVALTLGIGYGALFQAEDRNTKREEDVGGVPARYLSLLVVAYGAVATLTFLLDAPDAFEATMATTVKAIAIGAIFSVVGAATADSVF
ncbi:DUF2391 family protein [Haloarculaceae archaeon H-GB2-1]|nr:DUF2391 family protein [Haloarculaceae archaeon H-GB1-1]MEA5406342.1 DUF2391 family protein [Haloarculaceae archaeon H-GB2-1]